MHAVNARILVLLLAGCTAETHEPPGSASSSSGSTGDEQPTGTSTGGGTPAVAYCECMVVYCHDDYHGTWGEDHDMSVAMCEAEAAALPVAGGPVTQGEFIECRVHYCELAKTDPGACASAIGGGSCQ